MSSVAAVMNDFVTTAEQSSSRTRFFAVSLAIMASAAILAGWAPLGFSIVTVFLFAGPHNWSEARYFLSRMPPRWGRLRGFFLLGLGGVFGLTIAFAAMTWIGRAADWDQATWQTLVAVWNTLAIGWVAVLIRMRSRQNPRHDWSWTVPVALGLVAFTWLAPQLGALGLVYLHPLMALWILDRELRRSQPGWRRAYHLSLALLPLALVVLWWRLAAVPSLAGDDALTMRITAHAGAGILQGISTHLLVATHTFLEMLHYGVWLVAIPLVSLRGVPWNVDLIPLARRSLTCRKLLMLFLGASAVVVLLLWAGFLADYPLTRDVYFTIAMTHVLAEVPFLLRAL